MPLFTLTEGDDTFPGGATDNSGDDTILGLAGKDALDGGTGADSIDGGKGDDSLYTGGNLAGPALFADSLYGGIGEDFLGVSATYVRQVVTAEGVVLSGGDGVDWLQVGLSRKGIDLSDAEVSGIEIVGSQTLLTLSTAQVASIGRFSLENGLVLADNADLVFNGEIVGSYLHLARNGQSIDLRNATLLFSPSGQFLIIGGTGDDTIRTIRDNAYGMMIDGGAGDDVIHAHSRTGAGEVLVGGDGADTLFGGQGDDDFFGGFGDDEAYGGRGDDTLLAGDGSDVLDGGKGDDSLRVSSGGDVTMTGGAGRDVFGFTDTNMPTTDSARIRDFSVDSTAPGAFVDRIDLRGFDGVVGDGGPGTPLTFIGTAVFTAEGQLRVWQDGVDTIVEINTTGTNGAEGSILLVDTQAVFVEEIDFIL